jgi:general L-amino acid transport system permease protein
MTRAAGRLLQRPAVRALLWQGLAIALLAGFVGWIGSNLAGNLARRDLGIDFGFLGGRASFEFGENLAGYRPGDSFLRAFAAGLANTVQVAVLGILLTTVAALALALARLSPNRLAQRIAGAWIELIRNTPLLLQLLFWHQFLVRQLPGPRQAWEPLPGVFVSNRGVVFPAPEHAAALLPALVALALGIGCAVLARRALSGAARRMVPPLLLLLPPAVALALSPVALSMPALRGFNFQGGGSVSPEFVALLVALVVYQSAFMAETLRSGILAVPKGQVEAAAALGLPRRRALRLVVLPQALRVVVPPVTSQYLSLTKNSSLAVAIGYPDLVRVSQVTISETGRAIECVTILLTVYLSLSLATAFVMDRYNRRMLARGGAAA